MFENKILLYYIIASLCSARTAYSFLYTNIVRANMNEFPKCISNIYFFNCVHRGKALSKTDASAKNMFIHTGNIIVEKKGNLEQAMEDAINVGAEDVEEFKENDTEYFQVSNKCLFFK